MAHLHRAIPLDSGGGTVGIVICPPRVPTRTLVVTSWYQHIPSCPPRVQRSADGQGGQSALLAVANLATPLTSAIYTERLTCHLTSSRFDILHRKRPGPAALPRGFPWPRRPQGLPPVHMGRGRLPPPGGPGGEPISALLGSRGFSDSPPNCPWRPSSCARGLQ